MPTTPMQRTAQWTALTLALLAGFAQAEGNPYYLGGSLGVTSDSNVKRAREGSESSDTITTAGLRAGVDQPLGRGRFLADLSANQNRYSRTSDYDHTNYSLQGQLDWESLERLSGTIAANAGQSLYRDTLSSDASRNLLRTAGFSAQARLGVVTMWTFEGGLAANRKRFSSTAYRYANLDQHSFNGGLRFAPSPMLSTSLMLRRTQARYPNYSATQADDLTRGDVELGMTLRASAASTFDAHLSRTRENHSVVTARDYNYWTGSLGWNWKASGKTTLGLTFSRDSVVGAYGDLGLPVADTTDARIRNVYSLRGQWEASSKIRLNTTLAYARRTLDNALTTTTSGVSQSSSDTTTTANLGLTYQAMRNLEFSCGVNWEHRTVSNELSTLTYPYSDTSIHCNTQIFLR